jgi:phage/plasmid-associated DNA primase
MTALSLQRIVKNEFGTVRLQFKLLNYCGDLGSGKIWDTGIFKNLTGGDELVGAELKGGNSFEFQPTAKFWFNANKIPPVEDINDEAFFDRFILFYFGNTFTKDTIEAFKIDYHKIITKDPEEIQGIIHEAVRGLIRLKKRKGFRTELKAKTKHIWNYESDSIYAYLYDYCDVDKNATIEVETLYRDYATHCRGVPRSKNIITKNLERYGVIKGKAKHENDKGDRPQTYFGIKLKHDIVEKKVEQTKINIDKLLTDTKESINKINKFEKFETQKEDLILTPTPQLMDSIKDYCNKSLKKKEKWIEDLIKQTSQELNISIETSKKGIETLIQHGYLVKNYKDEVYYNDRLDEKINDIKKLNK